MREEGRGKLWLALAALSLVAVGVVMVGRRVPSPPQPQSNETVLVDGSGARGTARPTNERTATVGRRVPSVPQSQKDETSSDDDSEDAEEKPQSEEESLVEAFDDLTDKWQEPSKSAVTMADVDKFAAVFRKIPKERRDECIHRALNLIPDENVMLLAGVLMDKEMDKEIVETVYNDILNRDEDVKKPILQQIFKDKTHPCWADTAWILDVTGELPKAK